jgi:hypothetical protein
MGEFQLAGPAVTDALDHRGMIHFIGQEDASWQTRPKRTQDSPVRHISRIEKKRGFCSVEFRKLPFEEDVIMTGPGDVAGPSRAGPAPLDRFVHRLEDLRMLPIPR